MLGWTVSMRCKVVFQLGVCLLARLPQSTDCSPDLNVDITVSGDLVFELVLINDLFSCILGN